MGQQANLPVYSLRRRQYFTGYIPLFHLLPLYIQKGDSTYTSYKYKPLYSGLYLFFPGYLSFRVFPDEKYRVHGLLPEKAGTVIPLLPPCHHFRTIKLFLHKIIR